MKLTTLLNHSAIATLLLSASVSVFAAGSGPLGTQPSVSRPISEPATLLAEVDVPTVPTSTSPTFSAQGLSTSAIGSTANGKTRAQVQAELVQAEEAGLIPSGKAHNPPSAELMESNRTRFQLAEQWWRTHGQQQTTTGQ